MCMSPGYRSSSQFRGILLQELGKNGWYILLCLCGVASRSSVPIAKPCLDPLYVTIY